MAKKEDVSLLAADLLVSLDDIAGKPKEPPAGRFLLASVETRVTSVARRGVRRAWRLSHSS